MHTVQTVHAGHICSPSTHSLRRYGPGPCHSFLGSCLGSYAAHSRRPGLAPRHLSSSLAPRAPCCNNSRVSTGCNSISIGPAAPPVLPCSDAEQQSLLDDRRRSSSACSTSYTQQHAEAHPGLTAHKRSWKHTGTAASQQQRNAATPRQSSPAVPSAAAAAGGAILQQPTGGVRRQHLGSAQQPLQQGFSSSIPSAPWGLTGAGGLPLPLRYRRCHLASGGDGVCRSRRDAVRMGAFVGAAAATSGAPWHHALGLNLRGILWGIAFTLGSQLLLALLLRTLWAQRAIAALESWLQAVFGISIRRSSGSAGNSMEEDDTDDSVVTAAGPVRTSSSSSIGSSLSAGSTDSSSSGFGGRSRQKKARAAERAARAAALVEKSQGESVEWVNMCFRKIWRVYQRGLERWVSDLLQPVFDGLVQAGSLPTWLLRLRIVELTFDHEAPYFSNMRRRNSRKDSDLTGVVDLRYTGGARMLLMLELGQGRWRFKIPVLVSDLDVQCALWLKLRLAPMCPWVGTISLAFVGPPAVKVQLSPYNRVRLMRIPVLQNLLNQLLTVDLPALMVLPERLEISVPPSVTSIAEAAVGRDTIMRAVASAVLQVDSLEQALLAALPLGPQAAAGGVSLPDFFRGELTVLLKEGRDLPVWGLPWQSNPWVRLVLGDQAVASRRDSETSTASRHGAPVWNQEVQFLVEDPDKQVLEVYVNDSHLTGRPKVGKAVLLLKDLPADGHLSLWVPLVPVNPGQKAQGEVLLDLTFKLFEDDEQDSGYREAQEYARAMQQQSEAITDIRSAAAASSRAAVAASAAISAIAMTKAAAARAAARAAQAAKDAGAAALNTAAAALPQQQQQQQQQQQPADAGQQQQLMLPPPAGAVSEQQQQHIASAAAKKAAAVASRKHHDDEDGGSGSGRGPPSGGNGSTPAAEEEEAAAVAAAAAAKRREEALIEALEARMDFKVRRTGTPKSAGPSPLSSMSGNGTPAGGNGTLAGVGTPAAGNGASVGSLDVTVTLPADSSSSSYSSLDEEEVAVERAQQVVANILDKSKRMEAAVAELAALTAGSPAEAALQKGALKAAADAKSALSAFQSLADKSIDATAITAAVIEREHHQQQRQQTQQQPVNGNGSSGGSSVGNGRVESNGSRNVSSSSSSGSGGLKSFGSFASGYSIWGEDQPDKKRKQKKPDQQQEQHRDEQQQQSEGASSKLSVWDDVQQQQVLDELAAAATANEPVHPPIPVQQQQRQQHLPSVVVRLTDGAHVHSEVVGGAGQSTPPAAAAAAEGLPTVVDGDPAPPEPLSVPVSIRVQAAMTDESAAAAVTKVAAEAAAARQQQEQQQQKEVEKPWWSKVLFSLPGQKGAEPTAASTATGASVSSIDGEEGATSSRHDGPEPQSALLPPEPISHSHRAWWTPLLDNDFLRSLPGIQKTSQQQQEDAAASSSTPAAVGQDGLDPELIETLEKENSRNWWEFDWDWLPKFGGSADEGSGASGASAAGDGSNKPVEAIVIPADLPLEEIAKEVAKLKEDAWRSKEDHVESLWAKTVERNDRSWLMLLCFLLTVVIGLLAVVAYRIANMQNTGDVGAVVDAATVVAQLPLLMSLMAAAVGVTYLGGGF